MKLQEQVDLLNGTAGVLEAWLDKAEPVPVEPDHGPLGSEADILAFLPVRVLKAEIERGENEARVVGHELVDGVAVPVTFMLYTDGQTVKVVREASALAAVKEAVR